MSDDRSLTPKQKAELEALAALPDEKINTAAMPEQSDWSGARRGLFRARMVEDLDDATLNAIANSAVGPEHAALDEIIKDWTP